MDLKALNAFLQLSEILHFGKASQMIHVSPSTLSRMIQQLEEELGCTLFVRDNRSVELTNEGEQLQKYARETMQHWEQLQISLSQDKTELSGTISIYCSVTASYSFLHEVLREFRFAYPKIEIVLHTGDTESAIQHVLNGLEDVAIAAKPIIMPPSLEFKRLGTTPLVMIAPLKKEFPDLENASGGNDFWGNVPLILPETGMARERLDRWLTKQDILPNIYAQIGGNEAIVSMVSLGFGVGLVPKIVVDNSPLAKQVRVMSFQPELGEVEVGFCARKKRLNSSLVRALWDSVM